MSNDKVGRFFDSLTDDYAGAIERCFPRYQEMLWALLSYLPRDRKFTSILELGCGTGNLSVLLQEAYPDAKLTLVDVSSESLDVCRSRLDADDRCSFEQKDFRELTYDNGSFDLVISSIAIHHLDSAGKQDLFGNCFNWLHDGGLMSFGDQCAGVTTEVNKLHISNWKDLAFGAGSSVEEWDMWMQHQREDDHHDPLPDQLNWLRQAGFHSVDCTWRYLLWSVVQAWK